MIIPRVLENPRKLTQLVALVKYDLQSSFPGIFWVLVGYLALSYSLITEGSLDTVERQTRIAFLMEVVSPILAGFFSNSALMGDVVAGSIIFSATRQSMTKLWVRRLITVNAAILVELIVFHLIIRLTYPGIGQFSEVFISTPSCLLVSCLISLFTLLFMDMNAGYLAGLFFWSANFIGSKAILSIFGPKPYIFLWWASLKYPPQLEQFWVNKALMLVFTSLLFILCILVLNVKDKTLNLSKM